MMSVDPSCVERPSAVLAAFEARVAGAAGVRNAADGALVELVAEALREGLWQGTGSTLRCSG